MTDDEKRKLLRPPYQSMGDLIREEEIKMLKAARAAMQKEQEAWDEMKSILSKVGVKR
jgi:hypothetical protein